MSTSGNRHNSGQSSGYGSGRGSGHGVGQTSGHGTEQNAGNGNVAAKAAKAVNSKVEAVFAQRSFTRSAYDVVRAAASEGIRNQLPRMAAALSYRTIFSLIPAIVIGIAFAAAFANEEQIRGLVDRMLSFTGISQIALEEPEPEELKPAQIPGLNPFAPTLSVTPPDAPLTEKQQDAREQEAKLDEWIQGLVARIRGIQIGAIGIIGLGVLIYAALAIVVEIEKAFNQIYEAPQGRSWARRITQYWTLLTLGTLGLMASFAAEATLTTLATRFSPFDSPAVIKFALWCFKLVVSMGLLTVIYTVVPNTRVQFVPAVVGAATAAILWEGGKTGFATYLSFSANYAKLYGTLALLPLFLLWVYVTWLIVLAGLQVAHALQSYRVCTASGTVRTYLASLGIGEGTLRQGPKIVDPASIIVILLVAGARFRKGKGVDVSLIADKTGLDERIARDMLDKLTQAGMLHRVGSSSAEERWSLNQPLETLSAEDILALGNEMVGDAVLAKSPMLRRLNEARARELSGRLMSELLEEETTAREEQAAAAEAAATPRPATA